MKLTLFSIMMLVPSLAIAAPSIEGVFIAFIWLVVIGLMCYLLWWFVGFIGLPEPFAKVARVLVGLVAVIFLFYFLLAILPPLGHGLR